MTTRTSSPLRDPELVEMLAGKPELLAIADALVETNEPPDMRRLRLSRPRALAASTAACLVAAAAVLVLLLSPWQGSGSLTDRALAAVGNGDVLHIVVQRPAPAGQTIIDIATGKTIARSQRTEIWFDAGRDMKETVTTLDGKTVDQLLETRAGGWTQAGHVYTCAWIAAHPVEATKARVSCNATMDNGTTPRTIPETPPSLDEVLAGFVDRYQSALASGQAQRLGTENLNGREVVWLRITTPSEQPPAGQAPLPPKTEDVAMDAETYKPVLVRGTDGVSARVLTAETVAYDPSLFTKPQPVESQGGGNVGPGADVTLAQARAVLGRDVLWLGQDWQGLHLVDVTQHTPTIAIWSQGSRVRVEHADVIRFTYAPPTPDGTPDRQSRIDIYEATRCVANVGMRCTPDGPGEGQMLVQQFLPSDLRLHDLDLAIWDVSARADAGQAVSIARALTPFTG